MSRAGSTQIASRACVRVASEAADDRAAGANMQNISGHKQKSSAIEAFVGWASTCLKVAGLTTLAIGANNFEVLKLGGKPTATAVTLRAQTLILSGGGPFLRRPLKTSPSIGLLIATTNFNLTGLQV